MAEHAGHPGAAPDHVSSGSLTVQPVWGIPEVLAGDDLVALIFAGLRGGPRADPQGDVRADADLRGAQDAGPLADGDVLVVTSKVVSKSLDLRRPLHERAKVVAEQSVRVVAERSTPSGVAQIVEGRSGVVAAAAGVDASNVGPTGHLLLLPADPDAVARQLRAAFEARCPGVRIGVILSDTAGRPWRTGQTDFALGAAGVAVVADHRDDVDVDGRPMGVTVRAIADELAAAADLVKGKVQACPVALIRGAAAWVLPPGEHGPGAAGLLRRGPGDFFAMGHVEAIRAALGVGPGSDAATQVGIRAVHPEASADRLARALRVASLGEPISDAQVSVAAHSPRWVVTVSGGDAYAVGRRCARIEVALWSEDLADEVSVVAQTAERDG